MDKLKLKSTKVIEIEGFVDASEVDPSLYDAPYFAGPDGEVAEKPGPSETAAANHHAVAPRLAHHPKCIMRLPDITIP